MMDSLCSEYGTELELYDLDAFPPHSDETLDVLFNYNVIAFHESGIDTSITYDDVVTRIINDFGSMGHYQNILADGSLYMQNYINFNNSLSSNDKIYADSIGNILFGAIQKLINLEDADTVCNNMISDLELLEMAMLSDTDVINNPNNYESLKIIAVARHSLDYWLQHFELNTLPPPTSQKQNNDVVLGMSQEGKELATAAWVTATDAFSGGNPVASGAMWIFCIYADNEGGLMDQVHDWVESWFD